MKKEEDQIPKHIILFLLVGITLMGIFWIFPTPVTLLCHLVGVGIAILAGISAFNWAKSSEKSVRRKKIGVVWIWAVAFLTLAFMALAYWATTWPLTILMAKMQTIFSFPSEAMPAIALYTNIIVYFLFFVCIGVLLWAIVNSEKGGELSY